MLRDRSEDRGERTDAEGRVIWNRDVVFSTLLCCKPDVAASLPVGPVAKHSERASELGAVHVAWKPRAHAAITSSRT
jgi:hypothetical protein